jgi:hypothetical protein
VSKEKSFPIRLGGLGAKLDVGTVIKAAAITATTNTFGLPLAASVALGAASALSLNVGFGLRERKASANPYEYVTSIHRNLF